MMSLEPGNIALIVIFALLLFFVSMTGLIVFTFCPRDPITSQPRSWSSLFSMLILSMIRSDQNQAEAEAAVSRAEEVALEVANDSMGYFGEEIII